MSDALNFGKHKDKPLPDVPLAYVLYLLGRDYLRASRPASSRILFAELLRRLQVDFEGTLAEAITPKTQAEWAALKAAQRERKTGKLAAVETRRVGERKQRRQQHLLARQAAIEAEHKAVAERVRTGTDAAYFVMRARQGQKDVGDLL